MSNTIKNVWMGAIFMESKIEHMGSQPQFSNLAEASKCYLVEYNVPIYPWKFFWSIPGKFGQDGVFKTEAMKEDPPQNGERYWNDVGEDKMVYSTTLTLGETPYNGGQAFMYRQHFSNWTGAFMGSLSKADFNSVQQTWINVFDENTPSD